MAEKKGNVPISTSKPDGHVTRLRENEKEDLVLKRNDELPGRWTIASARDQTFRELFEGEGSGMSHEDN